MKATKISAAMQKMYAAAIMHASAIGTASGNLAADMRSITGWVEGMSIADAPSIEARYKDFRASIQYTGADKKAQENCRTAAVRIRRACGYTADKAGAVKAVVVSCLNARHNSVKEKDGSRQAAGNEVTKLLAFQDALAKLHTLVAKLSPLHRDKIEAVITEIESIIG